jgi:rhodanese-related sulfurtransferase
LVRRAGWTSPLAAAVTLAIVSFFPAPPVLAQESPNPADIARMSAQQAIAASQKGEIVLVDVRSTAQRSLGHIQGDIGVPVEDLPQKMEGLKGSPKKLVFYCSCPAEELALDAAGIMIRGGDTNVAVLVGGYDGWKAAGGPVVVDATWEQTFRVSTSPVGWGKTPIDSTRCRYFRDTKVAEDAKASGCIACRPDSAARGFAGFIQKIDAKGLTGRRIEMSAMVRSENVGRLAFLLIGAEDAQGHTIGLARGDNDPITGTSDWRTALVGFHVPDDAADVIFGVSLVGAGTVWIDDVKLVAPPLEGAAAVNVTVVNPSFEN